MTPDQLKGAAGSCPTVKVKGADGSSVTINEADFDPKVHEKFEEPKPASVEEPASVEKMKPASVEKSKK